MSITSRSIALIGEDKVDKLHKAKVLVLGLGGVGGTAAEALARSNIGKLFLVDKDVVDESNLNRQLLYTYTDIGKKKSDCATKRLSSINPDIECVGLDRLVDSNFFEDFDFSDIDFVIDAIDDVPAKLVIAEYCLSKNIPFVMSLGMGNRLDPSKVSVMKLNQTSGDPLAKKIRRLAKGKGLDISKITTVLSMETPLVRMPKPSSMMMVPSSAGLIIAHYVIVSLLKE